MSLTRPYDGHEWHWAQIERLEAEVRDAEALIDALTEDVASYKLIVAMLLDRAHDDHVKRFCAAMAREAMRETAAHGE